MRNDARKERQIDCTAVWYVVRDVATYIVIINRLGGGEQDSRTALRQY
jgi:hypothetical protein